MPTHTVEFTQPDCRICGPKLCDFLNKCAKRLQKALADCNESLRLLPNDPATLNSRGLVYLKSRDYARAIADYDAALKADPKDASSLYGRGMARWLTGNRTGGKTDFEAAKAILPNIAEDYKAYGVPSVD